MKDPKSTERTKPDSIAESKYKPTDRERAVLAKQAQRLKAQAAAPRVLIVSDYRGTRIEYDYPDQVTASALLKEEAFGTADDDFAEAMLEHLCGLVPIEDMSASGSWNEKELNFLVSVLKAGKPVDEFHAMLLAQAGACYVRAMRLLHIFSEPMKYDMPDELKLAIQYTKYDVKKLPKRRIEIENQSMLEFSERAATRLMRTYVELLEAATRYRAAVASMRDVQEVSTPSGERAIAIPNGASKNPTATRPRRLNGRRQSATLCTVDLTHEMDSIGVQKSDG